MGTKGENSVKEIEAELAGAGIGVTANAKQTTSVLQVTRRTLGRLIATGVLRASRVTPNGSSKVLVRRSELARFLAKLEETR